MLSQMTNFRLFQTDNNFQFYRNGGAFSERVETLWEKEKLLVTSNFSFSHRVFKRFVLQTYKNNCLFGRELSFFTQIIAHILFVK